MLTRTGHENAVGWPCCGTPHVGRPALERMRMPQWCQSGRESGEEVKVKKLANYGERQWCWYERWGGMRSLEPLPLEWWMGGEWRCVRPW